MGAVCSNAAWTDGVTSETGASGLTPTTAVDKSARIAIGVCGTSNLSEGDGDQGSKKRQKEKGFGQHREDGGFICEKGRKEGGVGLA